MMEILCLMCENGKMSPVESNLKREEGNKGEG
jgi:hypothetical protein